MGLLIGWATPAWAEEPPREDGPPRVERGGLPSSVQAGSPGLVDNQGYLRLDLGDAFDSPDWGNAWRADDTALRTLAPELPRAVARRAPSLPPSGFLLDGRLSSLPALYRTNRFLLAGVLYGGLGTYTDFDPWFGHGETFNASNPVAPSPATEDRITWLEGYVEPGFGAMGQIGEGRLYGYGVGTVSASFTVGPDIYQSGGGGHAAVEKLYGGLLYVPSGGPSVHVTAGRQPYTLGDGFLIHHVRGSSNAGDRHALYLGARNAHDFSVLGTFKRGPVALRAFYLDPDELEEVESHTTFLGANLAWDLDPKRSFDATVITIPTSDTVFQTPAGPGGDREGITTISGHGRWGPLFGLPGGLLEGQVAVQTGHRGDVCAWAGYASIGYQLRRWPWKPALVYRYARWSGDDPSTRTYERWDPLLAAGSDEWAQGLTFSKIVPNANLETHRVRLFVGPCDNLNITLDYFHYRALEYNNLGGSGILSSLASLDLGDELMLIARWQVSKNLYFQGVASVAWPGRAIEAVVGGDADPWTSLQASLYWFF